MENIKELKEENFFQAISNLLYKHKIQNSIDYEFVRRELEEILINEYESVTKFDFTISDNLRISIFSDMKDSGTFEYLILADVIFNTQDKIQISVTVTDYQWNTNSRRILNY